MHALHNAHDKSSCPSLQYCSELKGLSLHTRLHSCGHAFINHSKLIILHQIAEVCMYLHCDRPASCVSCPHTAVTLWERFVCVCYEILTAYLNIHTYSVHMCIHIHSHTHPHTGYGVPPCQEDPPRPPHNCPHLPPHLSCLHLPAPSKIRFTNFLPPRTHLSTPRVHQNPQSQHYHPNSCLWCQNYKCTSAKVMENGQTSERVRDSEATTTECHCGTSVCFITRDVSSWCLCLWVSGSYMPVHKTVTIVILCTSLLHYSKLHHVVIGYRCAGTALNFALSSVKLVSILH